MITFNFWNESHKLKSQYTFKTFVVGLSNQFAHTVARRVCENQGSAYNPVLIYGDAGVGKTHLMNAIGNEVFNKNPDLKIHYLSAKQLTDELISEMKYARTSKFKEIFHSSEVLLIDDIQYITKKPYTQEALADIFNLLYEDSKQIVITSGITPIDMPDIKGTLISRFNKNIMVDMQPPEIETKIRIIDTKAATENITLTAEIAYFMASEMINMDDIEGCLKRLKVVASLSGMPIDTNMVKRVFQDFT